MPQENYLITINGSQTHDGETDRISLSTVGSFRKKDDTYYISYRESEATGFDGDLTTVQVENEDRVTMLREGKTNSQLIIERGQKHLCHYDTLYGDLTVGIRGDLISAKLDERGGELFLKYALDINASELSINELFIKIREKNKHA